jgi:polysaccharide export outer membrane protein
MKTFLRLLAAASLIAGIHACATSGGTRTTAAALPGTPVAVAPSDPQTVLKGDFVPAVVGIPADPGPSQTYRIGPYDLLKVEVFQVAALSSEVRVDDGGFVVMPLIGSVKVGGLTPGEAEQAIANKLGENYLQNPQVRIFVADYASQKVTVIGQVKKPGVFPVAGKTTLMQAIALAGGLDDIAKKEEIVVFRKQQTGSVNAYVVNMESIEEGTLTDPAILGDDRIVVPKSGTAVLSKALGNILTGWVIRAPVY